MGILDRLFKKTNQDLQAIVNTSVRQAIKGLSNSKQTMNRWENNIHWFDMTIKRRDFRSKDVMENLKIIRDMNPDASMAIWNFLRLANTGHELECETPNGTPEKASVELLNDLAKRVGKFYGGGLDQLLNVLFLTGFTQGAIALEVELNDDLTDVVDFHAIDPATLDFRRNKDSGEIELVQEQWDGEVKVLNQEQVFYHGFDPDVDDPYGRSPILPILQVVFFQIEVLKDLKRVVHHQGYERFDISVVEEAIMENMPDSIKHGPPEEVSAYVQSYVSDIQQQMADLEPDDDFFHTDSVQINTAGGSGGKSMDATRVIDVINQQIVTALKQLPILLGRNEGTTETHGTIQWQIYVAGIESIQRGIKRVIERAYNVALQVYGKQRQAKLTFNTLRTTDRLIDAQAESIETATKILQVNQGWIDNDEASNEMVGHDAVAEPKPMPTQGGTIVEAQTEEDPNDVPKDDEEKRIRVLKKSVAHESRKADEYIQEIPDSWAEPVSKMTYQATQAFHRFLVRQRKEYVKRLLVSPELPTRVLIDVRSSKEYGTRDRKPDPSGEFRAWVKRNVLFDGEKQMELWDDLERDWMMQAAFLSGEYALLEIDESFSFNRKDLELLDSLRDRSKRSAELIQGVTDEDVIMELWDVVYEEKYSIPKAAKRLEEAFAFSNKRAKVIARTEMIGAARTGQWHGDKQSGMVIGKIWKSALQERTREGHREANNQTVKFDDPFSVANGEGQHEMMMFPGDSALGATASNIIQCRCWYKRILEGEEDLLKG